ncbi:hypothetical protein [Sinobaca sp. H24]|uniref:hypothetical protein n=1 Tax=Sinobaca sp. H24 TaxID=2923376 RepID=UPI00207955B1|nr:hypothetical protein [Sinobaca sp. H24]
MEKQPDTYTTCYIADASFGTVVLDYMSASKAGITAILESDDPAPQPFLHEIWDISDDPKDNPATRAKEILHYLENNPMPATEDVEKEKSVLFDETSPYTLIRRKADWHQGDWEFISSKNTYRVSEERGHVLVQEEPEGMSVCCWSHPMD